MAEKRYAFRIKGTDRRQEYIDAFDHNTEFITQIIGKEVAMFTPNLGFIMLAKQEDMLFSNMRARRIRSMCEITLESPRALREVYYALRNRTRLVKPFKTTKELYKAVLQTIIHTEIACDVERQRFAVGNRPSGSIFYGHHIGTANTPAMSNPDRIVGFTENIARSLRPGEVNDAMMIIHVEKNTMAGRLHTPFNYSKLTNSVITTAGGNYTRGVFALAGRFISSMPMIHCCDADAFGIDMMRTTKVGSMNSRHITLDQAFNPAKYPNMHFAGFYPSIGEYMGLPNDLDHKRPKNSKAVMARINFLKKHQLIDHRDEATWDRNKTYEMEALSECALSSRAVIVDGRETHPPIGLLIYLTEYLRYYSIPCKPQPEADDEKLMEDFRWRAGLKFTSKLEGAIEENNPRDEIWTKTYELLKPMMQKLKTALIEKYKGALKEALDDSDADIIRDKLLLQYEDNPNREKYNLEPVLEEIFHNFEVEVNWKTDELMKKVKETIEEFAKDNDLETETEEIEFRPVDEEDRVLRSFYDVINEEIGAKSEDVAMIQEALVWRLEDN